MALLRKRPGARKGGWSNEKRGRSPLLTDQVAKTLVAALELGLTRKQSATMAGISARSLCYWVQRGKAAEEAGFDTVYTDFLRLVQKAEAEATFVRLQQIREAGPGWEAAARWLARRRTADWGRKWRPGPSGPEVVIIRVPASVR